MFIGVIGPICSGKTAIVEYLTNTRSFELLKIKTKGLSIKPHENDESIPIAKAEFDDFNDLMEYATDNWMGNFVIEDNLTAEAIQALRKRPFFLLVAVDSPLKARFARWQRRGNHPKLTGLDLFEKFMLINDHYFYPQQTNEANEKENLTLAELYSFSDVTINNIYKDIHHLHFSLNKLNLVNAERIRPSWDNYFMLLTELASRRSNCMKRRVGCLVVKDHRVIATGYNGTPRNVPNCSEGGCLRCNANAKMGTDLDRCICIHAEENALLEAGRERIDGGHSILYCNTCPCLGCAKKIVQVGIKEVVYAQEYRMDHQTLKLFKAANVLLRRFIPTSTKLHSSTHLELST